MALTNLLYISICQYVDENILKSEVWDEADERIRKKSINQGANLIIKNLPSLFTDIEDISVDVLANQAIWQLRIDDTFLRAEMGVSYIQMSGVMVTIKDKDRSIAPYVFDALNISPDPITGGVTKRKVGSYYGRKTGTDVTIYRNYGRNV